MVDREERNGRERPTLSLVESCLYLLGVESVMAAAVACRSRYRMLQGKDQAKIWRSQVLGSFNFSISLSHRLLHFDIYNNSSQKEHVESLRYLERPV